MKEILCEQYGPFKGALLWGPTTYNRTHFQRAYSIYRKPEPNQVKIEVKAAAICGTDLHIHDDEYVNCPPVVLGHEMSGVVVEVGDAVTRLDVGDRVTSETFKFPRALDPRPKLIETSELTQDGPEIPIPRLGGVVGN